MTPAEFARTLEAHHQRCAERRRCRELAEELVLKGHIEPLARHLVSILGKQGDGTNLEALTTWVIREVVTLDSTEADVVDRLYLRLAAVLMSEAFGYSVETDSARGFPIERKPDRISGTAADFMGDSATC